MIMHGYCYSFKFLEGVPKIIRGSLCSYVIGESGPYINRNLEARVPDFIRKWGPGVPKIGGPHFYMTPGLHSQERNRSSGLYSSKYST